MKKSYLIALPMVFLLTLAMSAGSAKADIFEDIQIWWVETFGAASSFVGERTSLSINTGFTTLGVSQVDFSSSDPNGILTGNVYVMNVVPGGASQYAVTGSTNGFKDIKDTAENIEGKYDMKIDMKSNGQKAVYKFSTTNPDESISQFYYINCGFYLFISDEDCVQKARNDNGFSVYVGKPSGVTDKVVVYYKFVSKGVYTMGDRPNIESSVAITLTRSDGQTATQTLSNKAATVTQLKDSAGTVRGYAYTPGGLKLYDEPPETTRYKVKVTQTFGTTTWKLIDGQKYDNWKLYAAQGFDSSYWVQLFSTSNYGGSLDNFVKSKLNTWNDLAVKAAAPYDFVAAAKTSGELESDATAKFVGSTYVVDINDAVGMNIVMYVKADWLGIVQPIATPELVSVNVVDNNAGKTGDFTAGSSGSVQVTVKNSGTQRGLIDVFVDSCTNNFQSLTGSQSITLDPSSTRQLSFAITSSSPAAASSSTCVVHAKTFTAEVTRDFTITAGASETVGPPVQPTVQPAVDLPTETCLERVEAERNPLDFTGASTLPGRISCGIDAIKYQLIAGVLATLIMGTYLLFASPIKIPLIGVGIVSIVIFVVSLISLFFGVPIAIVGILLWIFAK